MGRATQEDEWGECKVTDPVLSQAYLWRVDEAERTPVSLTNLKLTSPFTAHVHLWVQGEVPCPVASASAIRPNTPVLATMSLESVKDTAAVVVLGAVLVGYVLAGVRLSILVS